MLALKNRCRELVRLEQWATHKGLTGPLKCYRAQHFDAERRLFRYSQSSPLAYQFASILCWLNRVISPTPRYMPKGSARAYRYLKRESRHYWGQPIV